MNELNDIDRQIKELENKRIEAQKEGERKEERRKIREQENKEEREREVKRIKNQFKDFIGLTNKEKNEYMLNVLTKFLENNDLGAFKGAFSKFDVPENRNRLLDRAVECLVKSIVATPLPIKERNRIE